MLWFKNIQLYRIAAYHALTAESIAEALAKKPFFPCGSHDLMSQGFIAPAPHQPDLITYVYQDAVLICLQVEEKILPAVVIKQKTEECISNIEDVEARKVGRKEARDIRERVAEELRPRAFTQVSTHRALIDLKLGLILVDSAAAAKAEHLLSSLREALGGLPTRLIQTQTTPQIAMTSWLENEMPDGFELDKDGELKFPSDDGAVARFLRQDLHSDEVKQHLATGKLVTKLGMAWNERIAFQLTEKLEIKRLNMLDVLQDELKDADVDTQDAMFESSAALFIGEMREFVPAVIEVLGGELEEREHTVSTTYEDPLYQEAVDFVIKSRQSSISTVQRQLRIGYNRAARLIEQMEAAGVVSRMGSNGDRTVLAPKPRGKTA